MFFFFLSLFSSICLTQIIDDSIPLHEVPNHITGELKDIGMKVWFDILTETLEIVITMVGPENEWMGVGFGKPNMENSYAITWELNPETNKMQLFERTLGKDNPGKILTAVDPNAYKSAVNEGQQAIQYIRQYFQFFPADDPTSGGQPGGWTLNAEDKELEYIMAHGNTPNINYHEGNRIANKLQLKQVPPKSVPIVCKNETTGCAGKVIECKANEDCVIVCGENDVDQWSCFETTVVCPSDYNCNVTCSGYHACDSLTVHSEDSNVLYIKDCITGSNTCPGMQIYCPERWENYNNEKGMYHCIIDGGDNGMYNIDIYNILGFRSMKYINYKGNNNFMGKMHCGLEYPNICKIDNLSKISQCLRENSTSDISCDDPKLTYFYCKGAQDPNGGGNCLKQELLCKNNLDCYVYCGRNEFDKYPCAQTKVICPPNHKCHVDCTGELACAEMTIDARESKSLQIWDCITGTNTCPGMTIYCPNKLDKTNIIDPKLQNCILVSGDSGQFDARIYSKLGFKSFLNGNSQPNSLGVMFCGDEYQYHCPIDNEKDACIEKIIADPNDPNAKNITFNNTCNNPPLTEIITTKFQGTTLTPTPRPIAKFLPSSPTTQQPTLRPTYRPSINPTYRPTFRPTYKPTPNPTYKPTDKPIIDIIDHNINHVKITTTTTSTTTKQPTIEVTKKSNNYVTPKNTKNDNIDEYILLNQEHELPINVRNDKNKIYLKIDSDLQQITIEFRIDDDNWVGVGFGSNFMNNTYAIIYSFNEDTNDYILTERILHDSAPGYLLNKINKNEYIKKVINGKTIIEYKRPFIHKFDIGYHFNVMSHISKKNTILSQLSNYEYTLPFIYAKGITKNFGYHYNSRIFNEIKLDIKSLKSIISQPQTTKINNNNINNNNGNINNDNNINKNVVISNTKMVDSRILWLVIFASIFCFVGLFIGFCWNELMNYCKSYKNYNNLRKDINDTDIEE